MTTLARRNIARSVVSDFAFMITDFAIGDQGHDPLDPSVALIPNKTEESLNAGRPVLFGPKPLLSRATVGTAIELTYRLEKLEAVGVISRVDLIATVTASSNADEIGQQFLYAIENRPYSVKTDDEVIERRIRIG